jgi:hypothetical protein
VVIKALFATASGGVFEPRRVKSNLLCSHSSCGLIHCKDVESIISPRDLEFTPLQ